MAEALAVVKNEIAHSPARDQNPALVYLARLGSATGRRTMRQALSVIAAILSNDNSADIFTFPWHNLRFQHTQAIRSLLAERYAPATANKMLAALRGTLKAAWRLGLMSAEDYHQAADIPNVRAQTLPTGRSVARGELAALLDACSDGTPAGVRDYAVIAVLYACGLRRSELVQLNVEDYDRNAETLRVRGKGGKWRLVPVATGAAAALNAWLTTRGDAPGALFLAMRRGGRIAGHGMTTQAVYNMLKIRARRASVQSLSPHDLRRSFVSDLLDAGADIAVVQRLAGHAQVTTTARYDRRPAEAMKKAVGLLHVPFR